ncbi:ABC-F family ATP-binding cassette domain-containing protein [Sporanaerobium hydrogeniformans]|uniref:ABC-F family ATP-binding cassette domain-containing protein n=1 Tax=Sporanaerobium hydrogeniformans TaxID=3072179 RepID=UPI002FE5F740
MNGTGKSSFLKILAGIETPDAGEMATSNELTMEYLPQNPIFDEDSTVIEQIFKGESPVMKVLCAYEETIEAINKTPDNEALQQKLIMLNGQMDALDAWQLESEAKAILMQLGITQFSQKVKELSGGQRKKVALAGVLIRPCNLLILDEPTNHLDNATIDYLEEKLKAKKTALLMVTHDRYFLDRVANKIVELEEGKLYRYEGNYEAFLEQKQLRESIEERLREKRSTLYKKELEWMRKGVEARRTKQKARQDRFYELEESLGSNGKQNLEVGLSTSRLGKKIIELKEVNKAYGDQTVVKDFTYTVLRGDRIGIIGNNGIGKSSLLNLISQTISCDTGEIQIGETVRIGYYTQESKDLKEDMRVIDFIKEKAEFIKAADGTLVSASKMLERFLFPPYMHYTPIGKLSGGERRRLYLLHVLMEDINVLLLDEPTNDLDIYTLQVLENYVEEFDGPVIAVSHDRYFLDRMAEKIFAFEGQGKIVNCPGNYSDYRARQIPISEIKEDIQKSIKEGNALYKEQKAQAAAQKLKMSFKEKMEYEKIEEEIENLEGKLQEVEEAMTKNATNFNKLQELTNKKEELESELEYKMERWEYLSELHEKTR